jgi:hypothetical protein
LSLLRGGDLQELKAQTRAQKAAERRDAGMSSSVADGATVAREILETPGITTNNCTRPCEGA